jgi:UDP-galactopyranose mutase
VGAGFAGSVLAERLANGMDKKVLVIDKRNHIGGNCYDYYNDDGILIHKYGPHIFHSNYKEVWDYLSGYTRWNNYQHRVLSYINGNLVPFPVNIDTINRIFNFRFDAETIKPYMAALAKPDKETLNSRDVIVNSVGEEIYAMFFKNYTFKQWGMYPEDLEPEVTKRVQIRYDNDGRYFKDKYQGMPTHGYTKIFEKMLEHKNIHIMLNTDYKDVIQDIGHRNIIYSGEIDSFYDYKFGKLPYRSVKFDFRTVDTEDFQSASVVNYPNDYDFTRITEYKKLTGQAHPKTCISYEFPCDEGDPYYPVPQKKNGEMYQKYKELSADKKDVHFVGRLATYSYLNMDEVIYRSLQLYEKIRQS